MPHVLLLGLLAVTAVPNSPAPSPHGVRVQRDPVAGVWKGWARGDGTFVSAHGYPATLLLERDAQGALAGRVTVQGMEMVRTKLTVDDEGTPLKLSGLIWNMPLMGELALEGERMRGKLTGLGVFMDLELERWSTEVLEAPGEVSAVADLARLSLEEWLEDLEFLHDYLPQVHADAFHAISREQWTARIDAARERFPGMDPAQRTLELGRVVAGVGDAHTGLVWREAADFQTLPLWVNRFADGLHFTGAHEPCAELVGCRILRVGAAPIDAVMEALATVVSAENEAWRTYQCMDLVRVPRLLQILGFLESGERATYVVEAPGGGELEVTVDFDRSTPWVMAPDPEYDPIQKYITSTSKPYWFEHLADEDVVYLAYNSCRQDPEQSMEDFLSGVLDAFDRNRARRLVVDLRNNSGGSQLVLGDQLGRLRKHPRIGAPGGLVALIGPKTYSSGMRGAYDLRDGVGARLVGMPTGGRPNSFGELLQFRLPNTGLRVHHSTKYFRVFENEDGASIEPDVRVDVRAAEYFAGEDPVLEAALELEW